MNSKLIIHDLIEQDAQPMQELPGAELFSANPPVKHCIGCFGCWVKTPGTCVIHDRCASLPHLLSQSGEMIILSRITYGGYSPEVKAVLDRSIGYLLPYFRLVGGEMHHCMRYDNPLQLTVHFYGTDISKMEQEIARRVVSANAVNFGAKNHQTFFYDSAEKVLEAIK